MHSLAEFTRWASERGWQRQSTNRGHFKFVHPKIGKPIYTGSTESDNRAFKNTIARLKSMERVAGLLDDGKGRKQHPRPNKRIEAFDRTEETVDGKGTNIIHSIRCSSEHCTNTSTMRQKAHSVETSPANLASYFRTRGWFVKITRKLDLCPDCCKSKGVTALRDAKAINDVDHAVQLQKPVWVQKRRIMQAINRAYVDPDVGYMLGENDASVAKKIGAEEATVAAMRGEFFGPVPRGGDGALLERHVARLQRQMKEFSDQVLDGLSKLETTAVALGAHATALRKTEPQAAKPRQNGHAPVGNGTPH